MTSQLTSQLDRRKEAAENGLLEAERGEAVQRGRNPFARFVSKDPERLNRYSG